MENLKRNQGAQYCADEALNEAFTDRRGHGTADKITYRQMRPQELRDYIEAAYKAGWNDAKTEMTEWRKW